MECKFNTKKTSSSWQNSRKQLEDCESNIEKTVPYDCSSTSCSDLEACSTNCFMDTIKEALLNLKKHLENNKDEKCGKYETRFKNNKTDECPGDQNLTDVFFIRRNKIDCDKLRTQLPNDVIITTECMACSTSCCSSPLNCRLTLTDKMQSTSETPLNYSQSMHTDVKTTANPSVGSTRSSTNVQSKSTFSTKTTSLSKAQASSVTWTMEHTSSPIKRTSALSQDTTDTATVTGGAIAGVGSLTVIAIVLLYIFYFRRKSRQNGNKQNNASAFSNSTYNQPQERLCVRDDLVNVEDSLYINTGYEHSVEKYYCSPQPEQKEKHDYDYVAQSPSTQSKNAPDNVTNNYEFAKPFQQDNDQNYFILEPKKRPESEDFSAADTEKNYVTLQPDKPSNDNNTVDNYFLLENSEVNTNKELFENGHRNEDDMYNTLNEGQKDTRDTSGDEYLHLRDVVTHGYDQDDYDTLRVNKHNHSDVTEDDYDHCKPRRDEKHEDDYDHLG